MSLAQTSSAMARGLGSTSARKLLGVTMLRIGSNRRATSSHSWMSRKKTRRIKCGSPCAWSENLAVGLYIDRINAAPVTAG
jgi:hypothetical protein